MRSTQAKSILNKTKQRDRWFLDDYTLNPYSGCSFNCSFCYIRGSKYGEHMEEKLAWKENAVDLLSRALKIRSQKNQHGVIVLSSATDPYLQWENDLQLTRQLLEVILQFRFPVHVITRSTLVRRDFDLLSEIARSAILPRDLAGKNLPGAFLTFSFSTLHEQVGKLFEPGAPSPTQRLLAVADAVSAGLHTGVSLMPLIPFVSDSQSDINEAFEIFLQHKIKYLFASSLTLFGMGPYDSAVLTRNIFLRKFPERVENFDLLFSDAQELKTYQRVLHERVKTARHLYPISESII
jgi:DNA repair photolyase